MSTGTLAEATLSSRERRACMSSDWPKTTASGGISPKDCARELTEFVTVLDIIRGHLWYSAWSVHPINQTWRTANYLWKSVSNRHHLKSLQAEGVSSLHSCRLRKGH